MSRKNGKEGKGVMKNIGGKTEAAGRRAGKRSGLKGIVLLSVFLVVFMISGCSKNELSDKFDEETVKSEAVKSVEYFNDKDYQAILDMGSEEFKESITAEQFADACDPYLDKCGSFEKIQKTVVVGDQDKDTGEDYAGVVMIGTYADGKIQFSLGFDEDMKLIQFLIK